MNEDYWLPMGWTIVAKEQGPQRKDTLIAKGENRVVVRIGTQIEREPDGAADTPDGKVPLIVLGQAYGREDLVNALAPYDPQPPGF